MDEIKSPKKPLIYYYLIVVLIIFLFNALLMPLFNRQSIREVDYGTFMRMTYEKQISQVHIRANDILFLDLS